VQPYVHVTGVAMNCSKTTSTFEVTVEQYISSVRSKHSTKDAGGGHLNAITTFVCHIPDSPRYQTWSGKPLPWSKRFVSLSGFLTGVGRSGDGSEVEIFRIDVDNITFCGQYIPPAAASMNPQSCTYDEIL
jgi:hypothetical protein